MIRPATQTDRTALLDVHRAAFGGDDEAALVADLLDDPSAEPRVSLLAEDAGRVTAHALFTRVRIPDATTSPKAAILCPLAVNPDHQSRGTGTDVTRAGVEALQQQGCDLVFVLGHPGYYPRFGFIPAGARGFQAPYPIPAEHADAWMVLPLSHRDPAKFSGKVHCADALSDPKYWAE